MPLTKQNASYEELIAYQIGVSDGIKSANIQTKPKNDRNSNLPPPMVLMRKGLWAHRELSLVEAEAFHLRAAAKLVGDSKQQEHLFQADCCRFWRRKHDMKNFLRPRTHKECAACLEDDQLNP